MRKPVIAALGALAFLALALSPAGAQASGSTSISVNPIVAQSGTAASFTATCTYPTGSTQIGIVTRLTDANGTEFAAFGGATNPDYTNKPPDQDAGGQTTRTRGATFTYPAAVGTSLVSGSCSFTPPQGSRQTLTFSQEFVVQQASSTTAATTTVGPSTSVGPATTAPGSASPSTVSPGSTPSATSAPSGGALPATGSNLLLLALLGAGSVTAGGVAVTRGRRRDIA